MHIAMKLKTDRFLPMHLWVFIYCCLLCGIACTSAFPLGKWTRVQYCSLWVAQFLCISIHMQVHRLFAGLRFYNLSLCFFQLSVHRQFCGE